MLTIILLKQLRSRGKIFIVLKHVQPDSSALTARNYTEILRGRFRTIGTAVI
jgi:hypothetical protein